LPASEALGVPDSWPVSNPKFAHAGLFLMLNEREVPAGVAERGRKLYSVFATAVAEGLPETLSAPTALEADAPLAEPSLLDPPQPASAAVTVNTAKNPLSPKRPSIFM
jgi:hypothetical protein